CRLNLRVTFPGSADGSRKSPHRQAPGYELASFPKARRRLRGTSFFSCFLDRLAHLRRELDRWRAGREQLSISGERLQQAVDAGQCEYQPQRDLVCHLANDQRPSGYWAWLWRLLDWN